MLCTVRCHSRVDAGFLERKDIMKSELGWVNVMKRQNCQIMSILYCWQRDSKRITMNLNDFSPTELFYEDRVIEVRDSGSSPITSTSGVVSPL